MVVTPLSDGPFTRHPLRRRWSMMGWGGVAGGQYQYRRPAMARPVAPLLADPRLAALTDYDRDHGAQLQESLQAYLDAHGDVRAAATVLLVHPNTVRYRIRRAAEIMGVDLDDPADRLLVELQLACRRRRTG